jgi:hypothetical protein
VSYLDPTTGRNALEMTAHTHTADTEPAWVDHFADQHGVFVGEIVADWTPPVPVLVILEAAGLHPSRGVPREDSYHQEPYEHDLVRAWHAMAHDPELLRRQRVVLITTRTALGFGTRYWLSNGWFIDGSRVRAHQHYGRRYSLWEPGAGPGGIAAWRGGADRLADVLALAQPKEASDATQ